MEILPRFLVRGLLFLGCLLEHNLVEINRKWIRFAFSFWLFSLVVYVADSEANTPKFDDGILLKA